MEHEKLRSSLRRLGGQLKLPVLLACSVLVATCGGSGGGTATAGGGDTPQPPQLAACAASMNLDGSITMPLVKSGSDTFSYTFTAAATDESPNRFELSKTAAAAGTADCGAVTSAATIEATGIPRFAQTLSVSFQDAGGGAFNKVSAKVKGGNLDGFVGGATPLSGATVTVTNASGTVLATGTTNAGGSMIVDITELPESFRVTATGGTMSGAAFAGSLKAEVRDFATISAAPDIALTPLSTLLSAYQERHPALSFEQTMTQVETALKIPVSFDSDSIGQDAGDYFGSEAFYAEARSRGSVDALVQKVLDDWDAGTPHLFPPTVVVDRQAPLAAMKAVLPADKLAIQSASCGDNCMSPKVGPLEVIGLAYTIYAGDKTAKWQADVINRLNEIKAQLDRLDSSVGKLTEKVDASNYKAAKSLVRPWKEIVVGGMGALHWLANNPASDYMPPDVAACDTTQASSAACVRWKGWLKSVDDRRGIIAAVTATDAASIEKRGEPMVRFAGGLSGVGEADGLGMLQIYRGLVFARVSNPADRLFFTPADSNAIWDHQRYWVNLQALTYFFFADALTGQGRGFELDSKTNTDGTRFVGLREQHTNAVAAANRTGPGGAVPLRVLRAGELIDVHALAFDGRPAGGPIMWLTEKTFCNITSFGGIQFDAANVYAQERLASWFACINGPDQAGHGLRDWRMPTILEWAAFTQVEGNPDRNVGAWMTLRGADVSWAGNLNGESVYAAFTRVCTGNYATHGQLSPGACSKWKYYFDYDYFRTKYTWYPLLVVNVLHTVKPGVSGYVYPNRAVNVNEYW